MRNYRIVKTNIGWNIEKKLSDELAKIISGNNIPVNGVYDVVANNITQYIEAEKIAKELAYSELEAGEVAIEF